MTSEILTQPNQKITERNLLVDEKGPQHLVHVIVLVIHLYLYIYCSDRPTDIKIPHMIDNLKLNINPKQNQRITNWQGQNRKKSKIELT